jgi:hypothetical protein
MSEDECVICLDSARAVWTALPCGHSFHSQCVATWFDCVQGNACPLCRTRIPVPDPVHIERVTTHSQPEATHRDRRVMVEQWMVAIITTCIYCGFLLAYGFFVPLFLLIVSILHFASSNNT